MKPPKETLSRHYCPDDIKRNCDLSLAWKSLPAHLYDIFFERYTYGDETGGCVDALNAIIGAECDVEKAIASVVEDRREKGPASKIDPLTLYVLIEFKNTLLTGSPSERGGGGATSART